MFLFLNLSRDQDPGEARLLACPQVQDVPEASIPQPCAWQMQTVSKTDHLFNLCRSFILKIASSQLLPNSKSTPETYC